MIVVRFKVRCRPEKMSEAKALFTEVVGPSRALPGVVSFDIAVDVAASNAIVATEVFEDEQALRAQESLPETQKVMAALPDLLAGPPEATVYEVSSAKPWSA